MTDSTPEPFQAPPGGVATDEVGAVTGDLQLRTAPANAPNAVQVQVAYAGSSDWYGVVGSPVPADEADLKALVERLSADPGPDEFGNAQVTDLSG